MNEIYRLKAAVYRQMLSQCRKEAPAEACGLLGGRDRFSGERIFPVANQDAAAESYRMDGVDVMGVVCALDEEGLELNAIYHSHPATAARPSEIDIENACPPLLYLILSLCGEEPVLKSFFIEEGGVREIPVEIVEETGGGTIVE